MKIEKFGNTRKIRLLPNELLFNQGDEGNCAFLINQGNLDVIVDGKKVEKIWKRELDTIPIEWLEGISYDKSSRYIITKYLVSQKDNNEVSDDLKQIIQKLC